MAISTDVYKDENERNGREYEANDHQSTMYLHYRHT